MTAFLQEQILSPLRFSKHNIIAYSRHVCGKPISQRAHLACFAKSGGVGVEVGVCEGEYSEAVLKYSRLSVLYSIDPWKEFDNGFYRDTGNVSQEEQDKRYQNTLERLKKYKKRSKVLRMTSYEASSLFNIDTLDFVYIDANHSYLECMNDFKLWWPKLKKGGIFAGHDYMNEPSWNCGVKRAVDEFLTSNKQKLFISNETSYPTWYCIKKV